MARRPTPSAADIDRAAARAGVDQAAAADDMTAQAQADAGALDGMEPIDMGAEIREQGHVPIEGEADAPGNLPDPQAEAKPPRVTPHDKRRQMIEASKGKAHEPADMIAPELEPESEPEPTPEPQPQKRTLKVDRRTVEVDQAEYDRAAQIGYAVGNRLGEMNRLNQDLQRGLAQLDEVLQSRQQGTDSPTRDGAEVAAQPRTPTRASDLTDEQLAEIREKLIYGDDDQGIEALRTFLLSLAGSDNEPGNREELTEDVLARIDAREQRNHDLATARDAFVKQHPTIARDEDLSWFAIRRMHSKVLDELRGIGVAEADLAPAVADWNKAFDWHRRYRAQVNDQGQPLYELRGGDDLLDEAAREVEARFGATPQPSPGQTPPSTRRAGQEGGLPPARQERVAEKEAMRVPRRAAAINRTPPPEQRKTNSEIVAGYRTRRHFSNLS